MATEILAIAVTPITEMGKCLFGALNHQIKFLSNYNTNIEKLRTEANQLKLKREDVETSVEAARRRSEVPFEVVLEWLRKAQEIDAQVRLFEQVVNTNKKCFCGLCPDVRSRLRLSKEAARKASSVNRLRQQGNFTASEIAHAPLPPSVEPVRATSIYVDIPSRNLVLKDVMDALFHDGIRSVAVHGMGGIGKTTLVNKLNNHLHGTQLFKTVIMVTVSKDPDLNIIQDNIAARVGLKLDKDLSTAVRGNKLVERLKTEERLMIILDDIWNDLDLVKLGIPRADEHMGCKIVLTTRFLQVCSRMEIQKIIKMEPLYEGESWDLFKAKAGYVAIAHNLLPIAQEIVRRCKGSPLALDILGLSLKAIDDEYVWKDALNVLRNPNQSGLEEIMPEVINSLRFSYDHLRTADIKLCFLFCCLFPEDYNISLLELRDYGIGEGFLKVNEKLEEASTRVSSFVKKLKDCGLLLEGDGEGFVKMHDIVRDVAISIASSDENGFLVNVGGGLRSFLDTDKMKSYKRISFMHNENKVISEPLECPLLRTLLIRENKKISIAEERFFEGNKSLAVLDLRGTSSLELDHPVLSVPHSLQCLTNLRSLYLIDCDLSNRVSVLGGLKKLDILKLCGSLIGKLPEEIGNLTNLICLDVTKARLSVVAPNVISRLSNLEELYMWNEFMDWDRVGTGGEANASLAELEKLIHLSALSIGISDETPYNMYSLWKNLKEIQVAVNLNIKDNSRGPRHRNVVYFADVNPLEHWVNKLLSSGKVNLSLESCYGIENIADLVSLGGSKHMEELKVESCHDIKYLISIDESNKNSEESLETVQDVKLRFLYAMEKIFHGPTPSTRSFGQLRSLVVIACPEIQTIFSSNLLLPINRLENLKEVRVAHCNSLREVFNTEEEGGTVDHQPQVKHAVTPAMPPMQLSRSMSLSLHSLAKLTSIWKGVVPTGCLQHLKAIDLRYCYRLEYLSSYKEKGFQNVEVLHIHMCDVMKKLILSNKDQEQGEGTLSSLPAVSPHTPTFPNLRSLKISNCFKLKSLFSFSVARELHQLNSLSVGDCENMKEIIGPEEPNEAIEHQSLLPRLQSLNLWDLSSLTSFIQGNIPISCPLKQVRVARCPNLKKFPLETHITSSLETIKGDTEWFQGLEWEGEGQKSHWQSFFVEINKH